jgi:hypothetical protein
LEVYFLNQDEKAKLAKAIMTDGKLNPKIVGKEAVWIADFSGFKVPENTRVLIAECQEVGNQEPLSVENFPRSLHFITWMAGWTDVISVLICSGSAVSDTRWLFTVMTATL